MRDIGEALINDMTYQMNEVINGELERAQSSYLSMNAVVKIAEGLGMVNLDDLDTNGWQWDAWMTFKINNEYYVVEGAGYYGGVKFYKQDEY